MQMQIFFALVLVALSPNLASAKAKAKARDYVNTNAAYVDPQQFSDYASQPIPDQFGGVNQQPNSPDTYLPEQNQQSSQSLVQEQAELVAQLPAQNQMPVQPVQAQKVSFLAQSTESATEMHQLTDAVQQQNKALMALETEQQQVVKLQTSFAERSLELMETLSKTPKCKGYGGKPGKVTDLATCNDACTYARKGYTKDGTWSANECTESFCLMNLETFRCDCKKSGSGDTITLCTDGAKMTTGFLGILGMVILLLNM